ncbi:MAG: hypothetical protein HC785_23465, partial [Calothrix sp. CSU_2_0]|nr:hypothetical protein [Calothrix sp. CSU_2_0]
MSLKTFCCTPPKTLNQTRTTYDLRRTSYVAQASHIQNPQSNANDLHRASFAYPKFSTLQQNAIPADSFANAYPKFPTSPQGAIAYPKHPILQQTRFLRIASL